MLIKTKAIILTIVILGNSFYAFSQKYFQQEVNYKIDVKLNDITHELSAFETIEYINNSPDKLSYLYFHLWPNAYDNNNTALAKQKLKSSQLKLFKIEEQRGYIDSLDFKIDGQPIKWEYDEEHIDICKLFLENPLNPGEKIIISTPFHVKIPKGVTSRLGHIKQSYQMTQWFPKPAVYDNKGWHQMPYLNMGEFYSEFGSFDVSITLPKNYIVGATGDLQNPEELEWMDSLAEIKIKIDSFDCRDNSFPKSSKEWKTIQFKQKNIHDFAWFADKRFNILKGEVELPNSKRKVTTWSMFLDSRAKAWKNSLEYIGDALYYYSKWYGEYPYNHCTAVHSALTAGGGMEYPNITVIGNSNIPLALEIVIMHEVGHNWFYGILGSNEREYTWLDEGINSFSEARYIREKYGKDKEFYRLLGVGKKGAKFLGIENMPYKKIQELEYLFSARRNTDQPASTHAAEFSFTNYGTIAYAKVARVFDYLLAYLGDEKFNKAMQKYFEDWKYKHPYPEDIQKIFEETAGEDLNWVFEDLLKTTKKLDYKILKIKENKVVVKNIGDIIAPLVINSVKDDSTVSSQWFQGFEGKKVLDFSHSSDIDEIVIDNDEQMLEFYRNNNSSKISGLCKKSKPLKFKLLGAVENNEKVQINYIPVMGWNNYNKFMLGAVFYNSVLPKNRFEYEIMPMFAFGSADIAGYADLRYTYYPYDAVFRSMKISLSGKRYSFNKKTGDNFHLAKIEINVLFKNNNEKVKNRMIVNTIAASNIESILQGIKSEYKQYYNLQYSHINKRINSPYSIVFNTQMSDNFAKASLTTNYSISFSKKKNIDFRLFAGTFLYKDDNLSGIYQYSLSGASGTNDYLYDNTYLGRFENPINHSFLSNQFNPNDGAFATYSPHGFTDKWLVSFNVSSSIPYLSNKIPLKLFFNGAFMSENIEISDYPLERINWETGLKVSMLQDNIQIFFPLLISKGLKNSNESFTTKYIQRVRFTINFNKANPFKLLDELL